jgi:nucleoside-diphosphate-sugar epimerase
MLKNVLLTGASGFVGKHYVEYCQSRQNINLVSLRTTTVEAINYKNIDAIVHLAGKAHEMAEIDPKIYFDINRDLTLSLAKKAKSEGVKQFIFISTVKVYGDSQVTKLDENSPCQPSDPYGQSKFEAEEALKKLETKDFIITIIRPPLVYGKGVKGNLQRLIALVQKMPVLPFENIQNQRSMVNVLNLIALIVFTLKNQSSGTFIAGDRKAHSTTELVKLIDKHLNTKKTFLAIPKPIITILKILKPELTNRLFGSYIIDNTNTNQKLGFSPPFSFDEGIKVMVEDFKH